jgi:Lon protease-like protein
MDLDPPTRRLPMFPLGTVLFPWGVLPLHVFEPRYRLLTEHCLAGDGCFGVVLIERGSEVGGGDTRFDVGTVARILRAGQLPDGRYVLATVGVQRLRVHEWLPDDPYPQAEIELLDDPEPGGAAAGRCDEVARLLRRVLGLRAELGDPVAATAVELTTGDVTRAGYEAAALAALGPLDAQALLELDDAAARLARLEDLLADEARLLEFRLSAG